MAEYKYLKDENISGKTIVVRLGLNSNVEDGELFVGARIEAHAKTLKELAGKQAKVVALAHQGRRGQDDFVSLKQHAEEISERIEKEVRLLSWDSDYVSEIKAMQPGEIILMENVRFHEKEEQNFSPEEASKIEWLQKIASVSDLFVQDAFSVCHRSQPSVIGLPVLLPSFVGPALEKELAALKKVDSGEKPSVFVLGGAKVSDSISLIQSLLEKGKADTICVGGLLGELFLKAKGIKLGAKDKFFEEKGLNQFLEQANQILSQHAEEIALPVDVAIMNDYDEREEVLVSELPKDNQINDIGMETVAEFKNILKKAKLIVMNGPMGVFEEMDFELGTKKVFDAISKSRAFSLVGGGDTEAALRETDFSPEDFSHLSLAGKTPLLYLLGKELPGLTVLQK
jgi:phosphoglycerate kinase